MTCKVGPQVGSWTGTKTEGSGALGSWAGGARLGDLHGFLCGLYNERAAAKEEKSSWETRVPRAWAVDN